jgi:hypothetical protein
MNDREGFATLGTIHVGSVQAQGTQIDFVNSLEETS